MKKFDFKKIIGYFNLNTDKGLSVKFFRDWLVVLLFFVVFLGLAISADILVLYKTKSDLAKEIVLEEKRVTSLKEKSLQDVIDYLGQKELKYQETLAKQSIADPSVGPVTATTSKPVR